MGGKRSKRGGMDDALVLRLPTPLISDILSRLPIESICSCKCVCKTLEKILRDPYFAELHLTNTSGTDQRLIIQNTRQPAVFFLFQMLDRENFSPSSLWKSDRCDCDPRPWETLVIPSIISQPNVYLTRLVGSCNGLLCLQYCIENYDVLYVCNPILGEFMLLPQPKPFAYTTMFGYCLKTKQYKVIRFSSLWEIHTLGTDDWRTIENVRLPPYCNNAYLNGNLHWADEYYEYYEDSSMIYSFNLETERIVCVPPPAHMYQRLFMTDSLHAGVIHGSLCVSYVLNRDQFEVFEVYVMKDYGVKESWVKQFTIDLNLSSGLQARNIGVFWIQLVKKNNPISVFLLDNGDLLLRYIGFPLVYYDTRNETLWDIMELALEGRANDRNVGAYDGFFHVPSFISLKEIAKGKTVEVVTPKKLTNVWSHDRARTPGRH